MRKLELPLFDAGPPSGEVHRRVSLAAVLTRSYHQRLRMRYAINCGFPITSSGQREARSVGTRHLRRKCLKTLTKRRVAEFGNQNRLPGI